MTGDSADGALAIEIVTRAGELLIDLRRTLDGRPDGEIGDEGDARSQELISGLLESARPHDAVLSEEAADDARRLASPRVWIVDPLDGTREYGEGGRVDWAVHVALWSQGRLATGAVALPGRGITLSSEAPPPLREPEAGSADRIRLVVSRTRPPAVVDDICAELDADLVPMGSAGAKVAAVVLGEADAYVHAGGQYEWDSAAPVAVARAAGLHASRIDGSPLAYNQADPLLPDLVVCRPELATRLLDVIAHS